MEEGETSEGQHKIITPSSSYQFSTRYYNSYSAFNKLSLILSLDLCSSYTYEEIGD